MNIVCIGAGNLAHHLCNELVKNGMIISQIFSRSLEKAKEFAQQFSADFTNDIQKLEDSDLYLLCVKDDAIQEVCNQIILKNKLVVHTSGTKSIDEINNQNLRRGVLYPVQSFSKNIPMDFKKIPICIEAQNKDDFKILVSVAKLLSHQIYKINSNQRKQIHLSAVLVNNFVNHLYDISQNICEQNQISFDILKPIIKETTYKIQNQKAKDIQTGPAKRYDMKTIEEHLTLLENENYKIIYKAITNSILEQ